jgi:hypothetical protein
VFSSCIGSHKSMQGVDTFWLGFKGVLRTSLSHVTAAVYSISVTATANMAGLLCWATEG